MPTTPNRAYRYPAGSAAPNVPLDLQNLATDLDTDVDTIADMTWANFAAVWTAATTNPVVGNGEIISRYQQTGKLITFSGRISMGSTTTYGSGAWSVSIPATAKTTTVNQIGYPGAAYLSDASNSANRQGGICILSGTTALVFVGGTGGGSVGSTVPFTWASGDSLQWNLTYEAA